MTRKRMISAVLAVLLAVSIFPGMSASASNIPVSEINFQGTTFSGGGWWAVMTGHFVTNTTVKNMTIRTVVPEQTRYPELGYMGTSVIARGIIVTDTRGNRTSLLATTNPNEIRWIGAEQDRVRSLELNVTIPAGSTVSFERIGRWVMDGVMDRVTISIILDGVKVYEWTGHVAMIGDSSWTLEEWSILDNVTTTPPPTEQPSGWAQDAVDRADRLGLLPAAFRSGFTRATTRAEFTAIAVTLYEHLRGEITGRKTFSDTTDLSVEKAAYLDIVRGVSDDMFVPDRKLTREEAATMLSRLAVALGNPLPQMAATFADMSSVSDWAIDAVGQMQTTGIMTGGGGNLFDPKDDYTIQQSIMTIIRMLDFVNEE